MKNIFFFHFGKVEWTSDNSVVFSHKWMPRKCMVTFVEKENSKEIYWELEKIKS